MALRLFLPVLILAACLAAQGQHFQVLLPFDGSEGAEPYAPLAQDAAGNLYGTTSLGGDYDGGVVFVVTPPYNLSNLKVLHSFGAFPDDGTDPMATVAIGSDGSLYGTTEHGGIYSAGTAYQLTPSGATWNYQVIHNFGAARDGQSPDTTPVVNPAGKVYGTTRSGGNGFGIAYQLSPQSGGSYFEAILYNFDSTDGSLHGDLIREGDKLYGPAFAGGGGPGAIYALLKSGGGWSKKNVYVLSAGTETCCPVGISFDAAGNIFAINHLSLIRIPHNQDGSFGPEQVLGSLKAGSLNPYGVGRPAVDALENVYVTTHAGGTNDHGMIWEFAQSSDGSWTGTILHKFKDNGSDGIAPVAGPIVDSAGTVYGTARSGGTNAVGTIWEVLP